MAYRRQRFGRSCHGPRAHSPRAGGCKRRPPRAPRPQPTDRPLLLSREVDSLSRTQRDLITQIYSAQQEMNLREFASYFNGYYTVPLSLTSHADFNNLHVPTYNSFMPSVSWDPNQLELNRDAFEHGYDCQCSECINARYPHTRTPVGENFRFKNNILRFCDKNTMTVTVNDVSCGICLGIGALKTDKCVEVSTSPNGSKTDIRRTTFCHPDPCQPEPLCVRTIPGRKKEKRRKTVVHERCNDDNSRPQKWCYPQDEAVRDTDPPFLCYDELLRSTACRRPACSNTSVHRIDVKRYPNIQNDTVSHPVRKILYNEGISDDIANNLPSKGLREMQPSLQAQQSISSLGRSYRETDNWIPHSHVGNSKYHVDCKKPMDQRYYGDSDSDDGDLRRGCAKSIYGKSMNPSLTQCLGMSLPKKMLTSEKDIDKFIYCNSEDEVV